MSGNLLCPGSVIRVLQVETAAGRCGPLLIDFDEDCGDQAHGRLAAWKDADLGEITPVIPPKANRLAPRETDFALRQERNLIERFFNKLEPFRAIAIRYDKLATTLSAGVKLAAAIILPN
jgi:hypothetical protein